MFSVIFDARHTAAQVDAFVDALRLFRIGYAWAGPVSLAMPYRMQGMRSSPPFEADVRVRFSVGLEAAGGLIDDWRQRTARRLVVDSLNRRCRSSRARVCNSAAGRLAELSKILTIRRRNRRWGQSTR